MPPVSPDPEELGLGARLAMEGKRGAKRSVRAAGSPVLGYFDRRFNELREHFDHRFNDMAARVATEVEAVSEMTIGMQRMVDVSVQRVRELAEAAGPLGSPTVPRDPSVAAFALASSSHVPAGAPVLVGGAGRVWLGAALASLGFEVTTAADGDGGEKWAGRFAGVFWDAAGEPFDAERAGQMAGWLVPGGQLIVAAPEGAGPASEPGGWEVVDSRPAATAGVVLVRAVPRVQ
jgi:hypothetical protein